MIPADKDGVYAKVHASAPRRMFAYIFLLSLGALVVYLAFAAASFSVASILMIALGVVILWFAERLRRATLITVELTADELRDSTGTILARIDDIASVERGAFAVKPSHGFTVVLKTKKPRAWAPGLWWRIGRRVGVGGTSGSGQTKFMAEQIALKIAADR